MRIEEKNGNLVVVDFDELEAYKIASKIEKDGIHFYKSLLEKTKQESIKEALGSLLREEEKHLKFFEDALFEMEDRKGVLPEEDNLLSSMDYGIFQPYQSMDKLENILEKPRQALKLGLVIENKSIKFYQACQEKLLSAEAKKEISRIIEEEIKHKKLIEDVLNNL